MSSGVQRGTTPFSSSFHNSKQLVSEKVEMAVLNEVADIYSSRPHPLALRVEEELHKLRACVASSIALSSTTMICSALRGVADLYGSIEELVCLSGSQQVLSQPQPKKWLEEEMEVSVRALDLCGALKDHMAEARERAQDLHLVLRKSGATTAVRKAQSYILQAEKSNKYIKNCLRELRRMDAKHVCFTNEKDADLQVVVTVLKEAREIAMTLLQCITSLMFKQWTKQNRWSFVLKVLQKRKVACEVEHGDFSNMAFLCSSKGCNQEQVAAMEERIQGLESGLECLFKRMIQNRVSLLNILSS